MDLEKKIAQELSGDIARKHIEKITREVPFRMAGTEELKRMAEYLRDQMSDYGIPAEVPGVRRSGRVHRNGRAHGPGA